MFLHKVEPLGSSYELLEIDQNAVYTVPTLLISSP
jgi:hypothetical protein